MIDSRTPEAVATQVTSSYGASSFSIAMAGTVVAASLLLVAASALVANAMSVPLTYMANEAAISARTNTAASAAPLGELHLAANGLVLLRGASVESITNGIIRCSALFDGIGFYFEVKTDANTRYISSAGDKGAADAVVAGSYIDVTGMLAKGGEEPIIAAQFVRTVRD